MAPSYRSGSEKLLASKSINSTSTPTDLAAAAARPSISRERSSPVTE
jgi:hypothetical protein